MLSSLQHMLWRDNDTCLAHIFYNTFCTFSKCTCDDIVFFCWHFSCTYNLYNMLYNRQEFLQEFLQEHLHEKNEFKHSLTRDLTRSMQACNERLCSTLQEHLQGENSKLKTVFAIDFPWVEQTSCTLEAQSSLRIIIRNWLKSFFEVSRFCLQ